MGGVSVDSGGKCGRKSVDSNVNMVPMIDLLISVIAFLLMTAVWVQTGALQAQQPKGAPDNGPPSQQQPQEQLKVRIFTDGRLQVGQNAGDQKDIAATTSHGGTPTVDANELRTELSRRHGLEASRNEVHLQPEGGVRYDYIIKVMDVIYDVWGTPPPPAGRLIRDQVMIRFL